MFFSFNNISIQEISCVVPKKKLKETFLKKNMDHQLRKRILKILHSNSVPPLNEKKRVLTITENII